MPKDPLTIAIYVGSNIVLRESAFVAGGPIANFEILNFRFRIVHKVMSEACCWKSSAHPRGKLNLPFVGYQRGHAGDNVNELVLLGVTVKQGGFRARVKGR